MNIGKIYVYTDIWDRILGYLELMDLVRVSRVNRLSYNLSQKYITQRFNDIPWTIITHYQRGNILSSKIRIGLYKKMHFRKRIYKIGKIIVHRGTGNPMINQIIYCYKTYDSHAIRINYKINRLFDYSIPISVGLREGEEYDVYDEAMLEVGDLDDKTVRMKKEAFYVFDFDHLD